MASKVRELSIIENLLTHRAKKCWLSRDCPSVRTSRSQIYKLLRSCFIITQTSTSLGHKIERRNAKKSLRGIDEEGHGGRESQHENLGCEEYLERFFPSMAAKNMTISKNAFSCVLNTDHRFDAAFRN